MARICFITGGARSGKSGYAQRRCEELPGRLLYLATARIEDAEMAQRVALHRQVRGTRWESLEEPLDLAARLPQAAAGTGAVLLDCVTIWLSNLLFQQREEEKVIARVEAFLAVLPQIDAPLFMVSNELGSGIVPQNRLARQFRDLAGSVNQRLAAAADEAWLVASGIPMRLK